MSLLLGLFNKISSRRENEKSTLSWFSFFRRNRFISRVQENYLKLGTRALIIISISKLSLFSIGIIYMNRLQTIFTRSVKIQMVYRWAVTQLPNCFHLLLTTIYFHSPFLWLLTKERKIYQRKNNPIPSWYSRSPYKHWGRRGGEVTISTFKKHSQRRERNKNINDNNLVQPLLKSVWRFLKNTKNSYQMIQQFHSWTYTQKRQKL